MARSLRGIVLPVAAVLAVAACGGGGGTGDGEDLTINIGIFPVVSPVPVMQQQKLLEKQGYKVNWVPVNSGLPGAASALAAGKLDMVHANSSSAITIFAQSPDVAEFVGRTFVNLNETVVRNDSGITSPKQLADRKVVVSGKKTASTLFYEMGARKAGAEPNRDKFFVSGTGPGMLGVLASGGAEVAAAYVPYSTEMVRKKIGRVLYTASDALGMTESGDGFIARKEFSKQHPDAVVDVLRATFQAMDTIKEDPSAHYQTIARFAKVEPATIEAAFTNGDIVPPSYAPDKKAMKRVAEIAQDIGYAPEGKDLVSFTDEFANTEFASKAGASS